MTAMPILEKELKDKNSSINNSPILSSLQDKAKDIVPSLEESSFIKLSSKINPDSKEAMNLIKNDKSTKYDYYNLVKSTMTI